MTALGRNKKQRQIDEDFELVEAMGQESDREAVGPTRVWLEKEEQRDRLQIERFNINLGKLKKHPSRYGEFLMKVIYMFIDQEQLPAKYKVWIQRSKKGISLGIVGTKFVGAFKPVGIEFYDLHACKLMAIRVGNTTAKLEGYQRQTEQGILLPDQVDMKRYTKEAA